MVKFFVEGLHYGGYNSSLNGNGIFMGSDNFLIEVQNNWDGHLGIGIQIIMKT